MLDADGEAQVACRQGHDRTGQVSGERGGLGDAGGGVGREQEFLQVLVGQRAGAGHTDRQQRVPRQAAGDRLVDGTAAGDALVVDERRAQGLARGDQAHVAVVALDRLVAVEQRTDVPVERLAGEIEEAADRRREAQGLELAVGGARHFGQAAAELQFLADRVEHRVGGHRGVDRGRARLVRVTGDLLVGVALVVQNVRVERDVVGEVVGAVDVDRLALDAGLQAHLGVGVGVLTLGDRVVVGDVVRVAALVQGAPRIGAARAARTEPAALVGQRAPVGRGRIRAPAAVTREPAVLGHDRILLGVLGRQGQAAALAGGAQGERVLLQVTVAFAVLADVDVGFGAVEVLAGDHVDHAGDGVRTVDGRGAVLQDFDALDGRHRDLAQVLVAARGGAQALAVHQHQGAVGAQVADVDVVAAHVLAGSQRLGTGDGRRAGRGHVLQYVGDRGEALLFQVLAAQGQDRLLRLHVGAADARAGDFQAVQRGGAGSGVLRGGESGGQRNGDAGREQAQPHCGSTKLHESLRLR